MLKSIHILIFVSVMLFMIPKESSAYKDVLQRGSQGPSVTALQEKLALLGYLKVEPTGYYGTLTEQGVRELQEDFNLSGDGVVGPRTSYRLIEIEKMARVVHGEARGESYQGQVAVAAVIKNRYIPRHFLPPSKGSSTRRMRFSGSKWPNRIEPQLHCLSFGQGCVERVGSKPGFHLLLQSSNGYVSLDL